MAKKKKIRAPFRKNRNVRARASDWTQRYREHGFEEEAPLQSERVSGKGDVSRHRTVCGDQLDQEAAPGFDVRLDVDQRVCRRGRVLSVLGLNSMVEDETGGVVQCTTRRLLKTLATDQRHVVAAGDCVRAVNQPSVPDAPTGRLAGRGAAVPPP
jgi:ribosome biogenesis GTPase